MEGLPIGTKVTYGGRVCEVEEHDSGLMLTKLNWPGRPEGWGWTQTSEVRRCLAESPDTVPVVEVKVDESRWDLPTNRLDPWARHTAPVSRKATS